MPGAGPSGAQAGRQPGGCHYPTSKAPGGLYGLPAGPAGIQAAYNGGTSPGAGI